LTELVRLSQGRHSLLSKEEQNMAIFCSQCRKELPDDAEFCVKCGKPVGSAAKQAVEPQPKWEYCEVCCKREDGGFLGFVFKAYF